MVKKIDMQKKILKIKGIIKVGKHKIGMGLPCFITAEAGINHNGSSELAKKIIMAAKKCGADAVKFQNYRTEDFLDSKKLKYTYMMAGRKVTESQFDMFKRCELSFRQIRELKLYCDKLGIIFFSTPSAEKGVAELKQLGVKLLKNSSDNIDNFRLIESMAKTGIPLVISTGMSTVSEVGNAIRVFRKAGGRELVILHCVSLYPAPAKELNLLKIPYLIDKFDIPVGFSDHSDGLLAAVGAVSLGACFIEKHFTLDKKLFGPDHKFSADPQEFKNFIFGIRYIEKSLGHGDDKLSKAEKQVSRDYRLSCVAAVDIERGILLERDMIALKRPGCGIPAGAIESLLGKRTKSFLPKATFIKFSDLITDSRDV